MDKNAVRYGLLLAMVAVTTTLIGTSAIPPDHKTRVLDKVSGKLIIIHFNITTVTVVPRDKIYVWHC